MSEAHQREAAIFDQAMELPPEEQAAFLDRACEGEPVLRERIEALLKAAHSESDFLDTPSGVGQRPPLHRTVLLTEKPGDRIGRYKLLEQIGEGGCGVVYVAEQVEPVRRRVALKIIKLGMDTKSVVARFEAERQALALMDHPNIAKVLDAGATETGRPFFVMELVRGVRITKYCDEQQLSTKARLKLFIQVCQAIQHAHQKGIIHRDIKPSNVLVTVNDGLVVPKVIDFGVAKATGGQELTDKTVYTAFEQFIGTPAYMSPEQALMTSLDIDTRSDIYGLGVLLYELLTGTTPFEGQDLLKIGLDAMRRIIREAEPPRPSMRLSTLSGADLSTTAQRRGLEAPKLVSQLRGDLDWIIMKTLEKDRSRRYETANGLAMDLQRHLANEPVVARPPSQLYRLRKLVRRNKLAFAAGSAVALSLFFGLFASTVMFFREQEARKQADEQAAIAQAVSNFLQEDILQQASSWKQENSHYTPDPNLTVREALKRAADRIGERFTNQPLQEAAVQNAIGAGFSGLGENKLAIMHMERALELVRAELGPEHPETLVTMRRLAWNYLRLGKLNRAVSLLEEAVKHLKAVLGPDHPETLVAMRELGMNFGQMGRFAEAEELLEETLKRRKATFEPENLGTLLTARRLALTYLESGKTETALSLLEEVMELSKASLEPDSPNMSIMTEAMAKAYSVSGIHDQALLLAKKTLTIRQVGLGPDHMHTLDSKRNLAWTYSMAGMLDQALPLHEETLKRQQAKLGPDHPYTLLSLYDLADLYLQMDELTEAEALLEEAVERSKASLGSENLQTRRSMQQLADTYRLLGKLAEAEALHLELVALEISPEYKVEVK
ncbi:MAG: tetratricopeptide repeat protein [Puniceicoccaceae bacterium]